MTAFTYFGKPTSRIDGHAKVSGAAKYAGEYNVPGLAHGFVVSSAIAKGRIPIPYLAGWPAGVWLLLADASLVLGVWPDIGALMLAAFLVPITILFHPFWAISDPAQRRTQEMNFYRNVSLVGAALALFALFSVVGPGRFAITGSLLNLR